MRAQEFTKPSAAGCILYAEDTGRYGLQQRSDTVDAPGYWAAWGGGIEPGETLEQCVLRELAEESGYHGAIKLHPLAKTAKYVTFIGVVPHEFEPEPCDEWKDFCWVEPGDWPSPMHPGTAAALQQNNTTEKLNEKINQKVVEPGFTAEKWIGGRYLLKAEARTTDDPNDHLRGLIIKAYDSDAKSYVARSWGIGMVRFIARQDKQTGEWRMVSSSTQVSNEYQRQGIASAMYQWARELGNDIEPSDTRTDQGKYFWKQGAGVGREYDHQPPVAKHTEPTAEPVAKPAKPLSLKDRFLKAFNENFADGQHPEDKGDSARHGIPKHATIAQLKKIRSSDTASARKKQLAHWQINMRQGKNN